MPHAIADFIYLAGRAFHARCALQVLQAGDNITAVRSIRFVSPAIGTTSGKPNPHTHEAFSPFLWNFVKNESNQNGASNPD